MMSTLVPSRISSYTFFSFLLSLLFCEQSSIEWRNCSITKLAGFWDQSSVFQKAFMLPLIIYPMLIVNPKKFFMNDRFPT